MGLDPFRRIYLGLTIRIVNATFNDAAGNSTPEHLIACPIACKDEISCLFKPNQQNIHLTRKDSKNSDLKPSGL
jgi:hypothetical protein